MLATQRIASIQLDDKNIVAWNPVIAHERTVAITDLLENNHFAVRQFPAAGPYNVFLSVPEGRLRLDISNLAGEALETVILPMRPFQGAVKEYLAVSEAFYTDGAKRGPDQLEAIDAGRRGLHNDAASVLQQLIFEQVDLDHATARRIFTLICVLHLKG